MKGASFGCGQCLPCRLNRRRIWTHRIMLEACVHEHSSFLTLTYNDDHLPDAGTLVPKHLQDWLKRFRKNIGPCRFFAVGEYGDETWRPHYHVAMFGHGMQSFPVNIHFNALQGTPLDDSWGMGNVNVGELTTKSAQYIAGYTTKKMTAKDDPRLQHGIYPEFARMSLRPGIGFGAVSSIAEAVRNKHGWDQVISTGDVPSVLRHGGRNLPLGRYMRDQLRTMINFKFRGESPDATFKKTAELHSMYQNYLISQANAPCVQSLREWVKDREAQQVKQMEIRNDIYSRRASI